jgi:dipeptidyl aminopeptidase/acylaminoacyl peptidase
MRNSLLLTFLIGFAVSATAQKEPVKVTDLLKIKAPAALTVSADGKSAAYTVTTIEADPPSPWEYKYVNRIWLADLTANSPSIQLTGKDGASQPAFSPDGRQLAFVRAADGKPQLFLISLSGGEARQLTHFRYGATGPHWSPDGTQLLFAASIPLADLIKDSLLNPGHTLPAWSAEKPGFTDNSQLAPVTAKPDPNGNISEVRAWLRNNETDKKAKVFNKLSFQDEMDVSTAVSFNHFFVVGVADTAQPRELTHGFYNFSSADYSPDGRQLILSGHVDSSQSPDRSQESEIFIAAADGSAPRRVLSAKGRTYGGPSISPTGKWLAFQAGTPSFVNIPVLMLMPLDGSAKDTFSLPFDRNKSNLTWSADEQYIYFTAQSNGGQPLYRMNVKTKTAEQLSDYNSGITSFDLTGGKLAFVKTEVADPFEVYQSDAAMKTPVRISRLNDDWLSNRQLSFPEKKTFRNKIGETIEYWIMKPTNFEPGKKYPLLLNIHGGPSAMWGPGETSMWHEFQFWCSKGYGVVYCNPRGSGGYGTAFLRANINDWGNGPTSDVLTALDKTVAEGWADTAKLAVTGGSYAGYLVAWIIAHDHRFKAACSQRGVYDLSTFFGEGNAWRLVPNYFGGYPWQPATRAVLDRESPITYVENITTPYIIFHGDNDRRTGFVQSEMLYRSLKVLNRPVEYVRHDGGTHELTRSGNNRQRIDQMLRTWEFFDRYIK